MNELCIFHSHSTLHFSSFEGGGGGGRLVKSTIGNSVIVSAREEICAVAQRNDLNTVRVGRRYF